ncbi:hypothetical protein GGX14DRAFT_405513 [Mycena pura]|uniref:Uncharacterized protein n=1 Tax=Mycena pura TaxID=153505 RepID=A0AAD6USD3_9AGAR|nr:hypothetical protein GGX14DRAFT_405513 [Mycena pura]
MDSPTRSVLGKLPIVPNGTRHHVPATPRKRKTPTPKGYPPENAETPGSSNSIGLSTAPANGWVCSGPHLVLLAMAILIATSPSPGVAPLGDAEDEKFLGGDWVARAVWGLYQSVERWPKRRLTSSPHDSGAPAKRKPEAAAGPSKPAATRITVPEGTPLERSDALEKWTGPLQDGSEESEKALSLMDGDLYDFDLVKQALDNVVPKPVVERVDVAWESPLGAKVAKVAAPWRKWRFAPKPRSPSALSPPELNSEVIGEIPGLGYP